MYEVPLDNGIDIGGIKEFILDCNGENEYMEDYAIAENGEYYCLMRKASGAGCALVKYFREGREAYRLELPEVNGGLNFGLHLAADGDGYVFVLSEDAIWWVSPEGELGGSIVTGTYSQEGMEQVLRKGAEGRIYYCVGDKMLDSYAIYEIVGKDPFRLEKRCDSPEGERCYNCYTSEYGLLCDGGSALYQYKGDGWKKVLAGEKAMFSARSAGSAS